MTLIVGALLITKAMQAVAKNMINIPEYYNGYILV